MPNSHCEPTGSLGTGELGVPTQSPANWSVIDPGAGHRRGFIVFQHGLQNGINKTYPITIPQLNLVNLYLMFQDFGNAVSADGWVFIWPTYQDDFTSTVSGSTGVINDVANDSGHGTRYAASSLRWFKHLQSALISQYGRTQPLILGGYSWGAIRTAWLAAQAQSSLLGYIIHCCPTLVQCVGPTNVPSPWNTTNWSGYDLAANFLSANNVTIPGTWGYGTNDQALGYNGSTTVASGSNTVDVSTFAGSGTLFAASTSTIALFGTSAALVQVATSNGFAYIKFTSVTGGGTPSFNNCTTISGSGTLSTGGSIIQSRQAAIIADGISNSLPVTANVTADTHEFTGTPSGAGNDAAVYAAWVASTMDPLAPANLF